MVFHAMNTMSMFMESGPGALDVLVSAGLGVLCGVCYKWRNYDSSVYYIFVVFR